MHVDTGVHLSSGNIDDTWLECPASVLLEGSAEGLRDESGGGVSGTISALQ